MKITALILCLVLLLGMFSGCSTKNYGQVAATTLPVYEFTLRLCEGTGITVTRLVTEQVSCLHDYTLKTEQMRAIEGADVLVINGGGLEDFMSDALSSSKQVIDSSTGLELHCGEHEHHDHEGHHHEQDPHFWLSPAHAKTMVKNIADGLSNAYPQHIDTFEINKGILLSELDALERFGKEQLSGLSCNKLITFHDGFSYLAECFGLEIVKAVEEESGSEASAKELIELIRLVENEELPAIFVERSGSTAAAQIISAETGAKLYTLDMAMAGDSYYDAMHHNIKVLKEALG